MAKGTWMTSKPRRASSGGNRVPQDIPKNKAAPPSRASFLETIYGATRARASANIVATETPDRLLDDADRYLSMVLDHCTLGAELTREVQAEIVLWRMRRRAFRP